MLRSIYSLLFYFAIPLVLLRLLWRSRREPLYRATMGQRFGFVQPLSVRGLIWVHAVSAGETNAAGPLVRHLVDAGHPVLVTTMTPTGRERVKALFGDRVYHTYAPYDMPDAICRFLARVKPVALVIIDTELWPNMIHYAHRYGTRILLVNARLSEKSARGYRRIASLTRNALGELDKVAAQTDAHGRRFLSLGLDPEKLSVTGSVKFDIALPVDLDERALALRQRIGDRQVILAASTHPGEDEAVLEQFVGLDRGNALLILVPRHPHRTPEVEQLCRHHGLVVVRHSAGGPCPGTTDVLLVDTMGELIYFYKIADMAFVGGSFALVGGHNPMEPAAVGTPVIMGPHLRNIEDIAAQFVDAGGMLIVQDAVALGRAFDHLLHDRHAREELVRNAHRVMEANRGALARVLDLIAFFLPDFKSGT